MFSPPRSRWRCTGILRAVDRGVKVIGLLAPPGRNRRHCRAAVRACRLRMGGRGGGKQDQRQDDTGYDSDSCEAEYICQLHVCRLIILTG